MSARILRIFGFSVLLVVAALLVTLEDAHASFNARSSSRLFRKDIVEARNLAEGLRASQEFSFADRFKVTHCRIHNRNEGPGFTCEFHFGAKTLLLTSQEMENLDAMLATYNPGDRVIVQAREELECTIPWGAEINWECRF